MTSKQSTSEGQESKVLCGLCPDEGCQTQLYFPTYDRSVECTNCGQRHELSSLKNVEQVTNPEVALHNMLKNILLGNAKPKKGPESIKVLGLSNYICKLVAPLLSYYGMDKNSGKAKLLTQLGQSEKFDCGILGERAFLIEEEHLSVMGYGKDRTGSAGYLADTLDMIKQGNDGEERLIPVHADGDGHCLVHAVSRALVGREIFWHALRENLLDHFHQNLDKYKILFKDFVDTDEWVDIVNECDPDFIPPYGEPLGLRNIHVFGLANVLKRPIILLDSLLGMQSLGDYSGVFLPALVPVDQCKSKAGILNRPLCIAWSSSGRNHYIPLVGIKDKPPPRLSRAMVQRVWGVSQALLDQYISFDRGSCTIGGDKCLQDRYILRLVSAMEDVFLDLYKVHPSLVADVHQYMYKSSGFVGMKLDRVVKATQQAVNNGRLYRCLMCDAICEYQISSEWFLPGGNLYKLALQSHGPLDPEKKYNFPVEGVLCSYDKDKDVLVPDMSKCKLRACLFCHGKQVRLVNGDGSVRYINGDRTRTRVYGGQCACGFKHYWEGKEYDNLPEIFPISLDWGGKSIAEKVVWFQHEADVTMNSNVFEVAQTLVQNHFPGEFGSERLVQRVVDTILRQTCKSAPTKEPSCDKQGQGQSQGDEGKSPEDGATFDPASPSKIILTGYSSKSIHKEELTKSETEKQIYKKVVTEAAKQQKKKTNDMLSATSKPQKETPKLLPAKKDIPVLKSASETAVKPPSSATHPNPRPQSADKKVRLTTSDGRQVMMTLTADVTFAQLQDIIAKETKVSPDRQKLRHGFPPREFKPVDDDPDKVIPLKHGDKVMLEVKAETAHTAMDLGGSSEVSDLGMYQPSTSKDTWTTTDQMTTSGNQQSSNQLLKQLSELPQSGDTVDVLIASLMINSTVLGKDIWTYVQTLPHLFSIGGAFYRQVERDLGLKDGKHFTLPVLPGKTFRFNAIDNRVELCLEPYGHFPIEPGVEKKALESDLQPTTSLSSSSSAHRLTAGGSGIVRHSASASTAVPFSGQGHSLKSDVAVDIHMPLEFLPHVTRSHRLGSSEGMTSFSDSLLLNIGDGSSILEESENALSPLLRPVQSMAVRSMTSSCVTSIATTSHVHDTSDSVARAVETHHPDSASTALEVTSHLLEHLERIRAKTHADNQPMSDSEISDASHSDVSPQPVVYQKLGPGYSVLNQEPVNIANQNADSIRVAAHALLTSITEDIANIEAEEKALTKATGHDSDDTSTVHEHIAADADAHPCDDDIMETSTDDMDTS